MWVIGSIAGLVGLALVIVVGLLDRAPAPEPAGPAGDPDRLPTPDELRRRRFATALRGYDAREVDAHLATITAAYERLYRAAAPAVVVPTQPVAVPPSVDPDQPA